MTIREAAVLLGAELIQDEFENTELAGAYTSDLLSDVMANARDGGALITIQAHKNTVAVATLVNITVIVVCNTRPIPEDMIEAARDEGIAIVRTRENQFVVSGRLYAALQKDGS
jgi:serine kinase of HPr protein (carbohydrate metabolism regulator)